MDFIKFLLPKTSCAELQLKTKDFVKPCAYVSMGVCAHDNCCLQRLEEDIGYPEAQGRCGCKLPYVGSGN